MLHRRSSIRRADKLNRQDKQLKRSCPFCDAQNQVEEIIAENKTMLVIRNRVSYDFFEGVPVSDHLMLIPRKHHINLGELNREEKMDYMEMLAKYESEGYSVYSRGEANHERSQPHIHTHLLMAKGGRARFLLYAEKPYIVLSGRQRVGKKW